MEYQVHTCNLNVKTNFIEITRRSEAMSYTRIDSRINNVEIFLHT